MNRRKFLKAAVASPVVADSVAKEAMSMGSVGVSQQILDDVPSPTTDPVRSWALSKWRKIEQSRGYVLDARLISPAISEKRSWSTAFKQHCAFEDQRKWWFPWDGSAADQLAFLARYHGLTPGDDQ